MRQATVSKALGRNDFTRNSAFLWSAQAILAGLFLMAGGAKLAMPLELLSQQSKLPGEFMRFIGVSEALGAVGLILPGLLRIRPILTPVAAAGLVTIMIGATVVTLTGGQGVVALLPMATGCLAAFVAYGRFQSAVVGR